MQTGIIHGQRDELFVFVAVDNGNTRKSITERLVKMKIPFINVRMGIAMAEDEGNSAKGSTHGWTCCVLLG